MLKINTHRLFDENITFVFLSNEKKKLRNRIHSRYHIFSIHKSKYMIINDWWETVKQTKFSHFIMMIRDDDYDSMMKLAHISNDDKWKIVYWIDSDTNSI